MECDKRARRAGEVWIDAQIQAIDGRKTRAPDLMLGFGAQLLGVLVRILSARHRFVMNPGEERIVNHASAGGTHADAEIGIARGYRIALRVEPAERIKQFAAASEKRAGNVACLVHQQGPIEVKTVFCGIAHRLVGRHAVRGESNTGMLKSPVGVKKPPTDHADLRPRQLAAKAHVQWSVKQTISSFRNASKVSP